jgi:hypothetical protein
MPPGGGPWLVLAVSFFPHPATSARPKHSTEASAVVPKRFITVSFLE